MNKIELLGRLTKDAEVRHSQGENSTAIARFTIAVNRRYKREGEPDADFLNCVAFGKTAENIEKYTRQGSRVAVVGRVQTGSYVNKEGATVYFTQVIVEEFFIAQSKEESEKSANQNSAAKTQNRTANRSTGSAQATSTPDGFMNIPDGIDEELPFN